MAMTETLLLELDNPRTDISLNDYHNSCNWSLSTGETVFRFARTQ